MGAVSQQSNNMPEAIHIIADFTGCQAELLESGVKGEEILAAAVRESELSCILIRSHQFSPSGYTAAALLEESHITLHTWPEHSSVQIDIFTCGSQERARKAYSSLKAVFKPQNIAERILHRSLNQITLE